mmetsp:Transcript_23654/g.78298  ORF Transcript_23654/g.78298 Transcript_23654/m.78298 type:complete len:273 (-) Transcript_23654:66-884(-)
MPPSSVRARADVVDAHGKRRVQQNPVALQSARALVHVRPRRRAAVAAVVLQLVLVGAPLLVALGIRRLEPGESDTRLLGLVRAPLLVGLGIRRLAVGGRHVPGAREVARVRQLQRARGARVQRRVDVRGGRGEQRVAGLVEAEEQRRVVAQGHGAVEDQRRVRERVVEGQQRLVEAAAVAEEARERRVGPEGLVEEARGALGAAAERRQGGGARLRRLALGDELRDDEPRAVALERKTSIAPFTRTSPFDVEPIEQSRETVAGRRRDGCGLI